VWKEYVDTVRQLAVHVRKKDRRVMKYQAEVGARRQPHAFWVCRWPTTNRAAPKGCCIWSASRQAHNAATLRGWMRSVGRQGAALAALAFRALWERAREPDRQAEIAAREKEEMLKQRRAEQKKKKQQEAAAFEDPEWSVSPPPSKTRVWQDCEPHGVPW